MPPYLTVRVVLNTAAYYAEVAFWIGLMGARRVGGWDRGPQDRGVLFELRPAIVVEVVDQSAHDLAATALGTVLACQVAGPDVVDDRYRRMARSLQADAVLKPLGDRAWEHRSFSVRSPAGAEVVIYAERRVRELECAADLPWRPAFGDVQGGGDSSSLTRLGRARDSRRSKPRPSQLATWVWKSGHLAAAISLRLPSARREAARDGAEPAGTPRDGRSCRRAVYAAHER